MSMPSIPSKIPPGFSPVLAPHMNPGKSQVTLIEWAKREGDAVALGEKLMVVETEKATFEVEAVNAGVLRKALYQSGEKMSTGTIIGWLGPADAHMPPWMLERQPEEAEEEAAPEPIILTSTPRVPLCVEPSCPLRIVILGAATTGEQVYEVCEAMPEIEVVGFLDDVRGAQAHPGKIGRARVLGTSAALESLIRDGVKHFFVAIALSRARQAITEALCALGMAPVNVIHPSAVISPMARIGSGILIEAGAHVGWKAVVADGCKIDMGVVVEHHCILYQYCHLAPGVTLGGQVKILPNCVLDVGSSVASRLTVGRDSMLNVNAAAVACVPPMSIVDGVPGRVVGQRRLDIPAGLETTLQTLRAMRERLP